MRLRLLSLCVLSAALPVVAQVKHIDTKRSSITIHVGKAGLFSAAAHEHWVDAPIAAGTFDDGNAPSVAFTVETAKMKVKPDPKVDAKSQAEIQQHMDEMTLETGKYPEIAFRSTHVAKGSEHQFQVNGTLTLHGVSKPVNVAVQRDGDSYTGHAVVKQTDFGIKPISLAGGTIRIKDTIEIDFRIFPLR